MERRKIQVLDDHIRVPLHGRKKFHGWALASLEDFDKIRRTCWTLGSNGYPVGRPPGSRNAVALHRFLIFGLENGGLVDHRDGNTLDARRGNIRKATYQGNARNTRIAKNNSTGFKGIRLTARGRWNARITVDRREIHIGNYATKEEAAAAYDEAARRLHKEFASPNDLFV